jgi:hypothetical protein
MQSSAEYDNTGHTVRRTMGLNGVHPSCFVKRKIGLHKKPVFQKKVSWLLLKH